MRKRLLVFILSLIMLVGMLTGCGIVIAEKMMEPLQKFNPLEKVDEDSLTEDLSEYEEIEWPDTDVAKMIPKPKSMIGKFVYEADDGMMVEIANTSRDAYKDYVEKCKKLGYTENHINMDGMYRGDNDDGYGVVIQLDEDNHVMTIIFGDSDM